MASPEKFAVSYREFDKFSKKVGVPAHKYMKEPRDCQSVLS